MRKGQTTSPTDVVSEEISVSDFVELVDGVVTREEVVVSVTGGADQAATEPNSPLPGEASATATSKTEDQLLRRVEPIFPGLVASIKSRKVSFNNLTDAQDGSDGHVDTEHKSDYIAIFPLVRKVFVDCHGDLVDFYPSYRTGTYAARTVPNKPVQRPMFHFLYDLGKAPIATEMFSKITQLSYDADRNLHKRDLIRCHDELYSSTTDLIGVLERHRKTKEQKIDQQLEKDKLATIERDLAELERRYLQTRARIDYSFGVFIGMVTAAAALLGLAPIAGVGSVYIIAAVLAAFGATLSVAQKMADDSLAIKYDVGRWYVRLLGFTRPVIGSSAGILLLLAMIANLIPLSLSGSSGAAYVLVAGFAIGWAERAIPDIFRRIGFTSGLPPQTSSPGATGGDSQH